MENRTHIPSSLLVLALVVSGCNGAGPSTTTPLVPSSVAVAAPAVRPGATDWLDGYTLMNASLSGVVYESTPTGRVAIPGAVLYCERCGEITHTWATADANGFYRFPGNPAAGGGIWLAPGKPTLILARGVGFEQQSWVEWAHDVVIAGDTRLDVELVRR